MKPASPKNPLFLSLRSLVTASKGQNKTYVPKNLFFALLLSVVMCSPVMANIIEKPEAIVFNGLSSSKAVLEGDYELAIKKSNSGRMKSLNLQDQAAMKINLCVAYLKTGMFEAAEDACVSAKKMARKKKINTGMYFYTSNYQKYKNQLLMASEQNLALIEAYK